MQQQEVVLYIDIWCNIGNWFGQCMS